MEYKNVAQIMDGPYALSDSCQSLGSPRHSQLGMIATRTVLDVPMDLQSKTMEYNLSMHQSFSWIHLTIVAWKT